MSFQPRVRRVVTVMSATLDGRTLRDDAPCPGPTGSVIAETYRVGRHLGSGGMGDVYEAEHIRLARPVAVKFLRINCVAERHVVDRFRQEARRLAAVQSDNVVNVFDCGELDDGTPYIVMERLFGVDLRALLGRAGTLPIRRAVRLMIDTCRGLTAIHSAGLIHRDLKPANLFVVQTADGGERCKVLDLGVAKAVASDATRPGSLLGTPRYMAPEQLEDATSADASADVYAAATILYECLAGVPAHRGTTPQEILFDMLYRDRRPLSESCDVPRELESILERALSRDRRARFESAEVFAAALSPFAPKQEDPWRGVDQNADTVHETAERPVCPRRRSHAARSRMVTAGVMIGVGVGSLIWARHGGEAPAAARPQRSTTATATAINCVPDARSGDSESPSPRQLSSAEVIDVTQKPAPAETVGKVPAAPGRRALRSAHRSDLLKHFDPENPYN
jgi:eukaryotic-like serine/threonine-protein kinase